MTAVIASSTSERSAQAGKVNLLGMPRPWLESWFEEIGEKKFRAQQLLKWMHHEGVTDFEAMTNLSRALRDKLSAIAEVRPPEV